MIKTTVWTDRDDGAEAATDRVPKCIFVGEISAVPREGEHIVVRDDLEARVVHHVLYDFVRGVVEITVRGDDRDNEYGPCLLTHRGNKS